MTNNEGQDAHHVKQVNYDRLRTLWGYGAGIALAVGAGFTLGPKYSLLQGLMYSHTIKGYLALGVLAAAVIWLIRYTLATRAELTLFRNYHILERAAPVGGTAEVAVVIVSLAFGCLLGAVTNPVIFCVIAVVIQFMDCVGLWLIQRAFFEVCFETDTIIDRNLLNYYFRRPRFVLVGAKLVCFMAALTLAALAEPARQPVFEILSRILVFVTIVVAEGFQFAWRRGLPIR